LLATNAGVPAVYRLAGSGAIDGATPEAVNFMLDRLAAAATFMRDSIADAYVAAADQKVNYPGVLVRDVESGAAAPPDPVVKN
jgi:hypothetical protein